MNAWILANLSQIVAALLFLIVVGFDLKKKAVPSIFGTAIIFVLAVVNSHNIAFGGIMFVFAWMMYEAGVFKGMADVKMITALGLLSSSITGVLALVIVLTIYTAIYNALMRMVLKVEGDYAGTLPIYLSYLCVWLVGGLA